MRTLYVQTTFRDGSDVEMLEATAENDGVEEWAPPSSVESDDANAVVAGVMEKVFEIWDVGLDNALDRYEDVTGGSLQGQVHLLYSDPPYNVRSIQNRSSSDYDVWSNTDMDNMV